MTPQDLYWLIDHPLWILIALNALILMVLMVLVAMVFLAVRYLTYNQVWMAESLAQELEQLGAVTKTPRPGLSPPGGNPHE